LRIATIVRNAQLARLPRDSRALRPLIEEESQAWAADLDWDYADVARALLAGLENGSLRGFGFEDSGKVVAYGYYLLDGRRAVLGSLFAAATHRGRGYEASLVDALVADARGNSPGGARGRRIECQTLFTSDQAVDERFRLLGFASHDRHYLRASLAGAARPAAAIAGARSLTLGDIPQAAAVIHRSHQGTVDAEMNTTYKTENHCRSFLETLILRSGCGEFDAEASLFVEGAPGTGALAVLLASRLSRDNGHICQVSVVPQAQGKGLGRALVTHALEVFRARGLGQATLSATVANARAYALYRELGFAPRRVFKAHAWQAPA
jgi:ribosomal protein S18 acetylase RimI-like enzyme